MGGPVTALNTTLQQLKSGEEKVAAPSEISPTGRLLPPKVQLKRSQSIGLNLVLRTTGPFLILAAWILASASGAISSQQFPALWEVIAALKTLAADGTLWANLSVSLRRAFIGVIFGISCGFSLGILSGLFRLGDQLIDPMVQIIRTVPVLAITPLLIIWFGIDELPKIIIIALATAMPTYINTHLGVRHVDSKLLESGRIHGLNTPQLVWMVIIPEALPQMLLGLRIAMTGSLLALVVAELSNTQMGIGFLMTSAQQYFQTDIMVGCIVLYALAGLLADTFVRFLERILMPYKFAEVVKK